jgi:hypothetical protein
MLFGSKLLSLPALMLAPLTTAPVVEGIAAEPRVG